MSEVDTHFRCKSGPSGSGFILSWVFGHFISFSSSLRRYDRPRMLSTWQGVVKLAPEKKLLTNILKMVAYQAESDLVRQVAPHYRRAEDEGRTLVQSALAAAADIEVTNHELRVHIVPLSSLLRLRLFDSVEERESRVV